MLVETGERNGRSKSLPLLRVTAGKPVELVYQLGEPVWFQVHWLGRQFLCSGDGCPACEGTATRLRGFMPCTIQFKGSPRPVLLELSSSAWSRGIASGEVSGFPPKAGTKVVASRAKAKSPLTLDAIGEGFKIGEKLSERELTIGAVAMIHGIAPLNEGESVEDWSARTKAYRHLLITNNL